MRVCMYVLMGLVLPIVALVPGSRTQACDPDWPPWVLVVAPTDGADVTSGCEIVAKLKDCPIEVTSVKFLVDGKLVGRDDTADEEGTFSFQWDAAAVEAGEHIISAKAKLANGDIVTKSDKVKVAVK